MARDWYVGLLTLSLVLSGLQLSSAFCFGRGVPQLLSHQGSVGNLRAITYHRRPRAHGSLGVKMQGPELKDEELTQMEAELKDSQGWLGYVAPRPIRKVLWGALAANAFWGALILFGSNSANQQSVPLDKVAENLVFAAAFSVLLWNEFRDQSNRTERRTKLRKKQIEIGDREVFEKFDKASGRTRTFSRLKPVDDSWILRRIDRWGVVETYESGGNPLPTVGPAKGAILEQLVEEKKPNFILDIGSFVGYAAIRMARKQPAGGLTVTIEKDLRWHLSSKRFVWQSKLWQQYPWGEEPERKVECWYGDALERMDEVKETYGVPDMILIDANTKEYRDYLAKIEEAGLVKPGTVVIADNTGLFKEFAGVKEYLEYVRSSDKWKTESIETTLEYRDDTPDEMEMSEYQG
mmetsp:Transcript_46953/g.73488  ORF Transcript_46953/g.73488 Transcript_46953/m.73488 type:complete len:407 (+) Transcript_46953:52-1272(+)|eukprot:CAMPEP_0184298920 /NCGR_PEP_ID=MMETSP1049-20130417/9636_1 /TAXON_ID=77928 /ORGANISM="Proteomonas sulcata, Strain CCMP704" /LENGTH=406 /DNA_ID=CAMNT_0026609201 /DNA_START=50 /DNA_END=1270 /DNA_ORIENTATION=+